MVLSFRVIVLVRGRGKISLGDGGDASNLAIIRGHGNFTEYVPIALVLMALLESGGVDPRIIHGCGIVLVLSRIFHPMGLSSDPESKPPLSRLLGAGATFLVIVVMSLACLRIAVF